MTSRGETQIPTLQPTSTHVSKIQMWPNEESNTVTDKRRRGKTTDRDRDKQRQKYTDKTQRHSETERHGEKQR